MRTIEFRPRKPRRLIASSYIACPTVEIAASRSIPPVPSSPQSRRAAELPELGQPFFDEDLDHQGYRRITREALLDHYTYDYLYAYGASRVPRCKTPTTGGFDCWTTINVEGGVAALAPMMNLLRAGARRARRDVWRRGGCGAEMG